MRRSKVITINTFTAILGRLCGGRGHQQIPFVWRGKSDRPPDSENEQVSCCCRKTYMLALNLLCDKR